MAIVELPQEQANLLASLGLATELSTDMTDDQWFEITDRLGDEIQTNGINEAGDGTNERGKTCQQILDAMAEAEG